MRGPRAGTRAGRAPRSGSGAGRARGRAWGLGLSRARARGAGRHPCLGPGGALPVPAFFLFLVGEGIAVGGRREK